MSGYMYYPFLTVILVYLLYVLYTIVRPELSRVQAVPMRALTAAERALLPPDAVQDADSPVYRLQGPVFRGAMLGVESSNIETTLWDYKVGHYTFAADRIHPAYQSLAAQLHSGQTVAIEFSPKSKMVWKISPLNARPSA